MHLFSILWLHLQAKYVGRRTLSWLAWLLLANGSSNDLVVAYLVLVVDVDFPRLGYQLDGIHIPEGRSLAQFVLVSNQRHFVTICATISRRGPITTTKSVLRGLGNQTSSASLAAPGAEGKDRQ